MARQGVTNTQKRPAGKTQDSTPKGRLVCTPKENETTFCPREQEQAHKHVFRFALLFLFLPFSLSLVVALPALVFALLLWYSSTVL